MSTDLSGQISHPKPSLIIGWWHIIQATVVALRDARAERKAAAQANLSIGQQRDLFLRDRGCSCYYQAKVCGSCEHLADDIFGR